LLETSRQIRGVTNGGIVHAEVIANRPNDDEPRIQSHTELTCLAIGLPEVCLFEGALERKSRQHTTSSMIFMGDGSTEERHKPITEELVDRAFVPMHRVKRYLKKND
jgi:hypothetical protein